ncbi:ABC transporter permease [Actinomadura logoneensis]|uniref:ABC transporter permease n=1 Tax=Actinomadura logoneensis TaxID=2293572 RepID=A0A372JE59_9ACTN|nr:ABC transporter permease [Actinomadura logoneensis]RFU38260.1 ABC transporter permease [Actinomadura logoneensis]
MWLAPERRSARRWAVPVLVLLAGLAVGGVLLADGRRGTALTALAVLAGYAAHLAYRRDEQGLAISESFGRGHRGRTHLKAAAMTGDVLSAGLVAALVVQALRGADITPYAWLALLAGVTYLLSALTGGRAP